MTILAAGQQCGDPTTGDNGEVVRWEPLVARERDGARLWGPIVKMGSGPSSRTGNYGFLFLMGSLTKYSMRVNTANINRKKIQPTPKSPKMGDGSTGPVPILRGIKRFHTVMGKAVAAGVAY